MAMVHIANYTMEFSQVPKICQEKKVFVDNGRMKMWIKNQNINKSVAYW